ncbi:MAG: TIGR01457 family HAD-type hydrolase [Bacillota bacterium]|uniref:Acid sugar phosphatase n=1 Tax=Virgibacillus salarius TaxID=447199 RepID=A0A941DQ97_9BACI|nr:MULTISPECIES: TIGR01457 family HAD-type hydrolase [Bacillaceae]NAZ07252.1 TIGR01457 family HAD-type hydrolase [Agaribacter marinus]MBR7794530.1 TIGR01457 family HAD-type hydrolase [Virgibacillus salarius]MCC2249481.1 TIGR01457 family HAD-type hydrolase [Virgibacillus sp. AGTR]MDY7043321.1 TIGR01457 family HAD-type hydrolase [Virgibacillus sp. M23]QRZ17847.1 TIGR01457 family HAD-type hydrolase [Virgibacillus sp. AGTR]
MKHAYKGYLIDLDGTMYRGNEPIEAAAEFIATLKTNNIPHVFVTNNSSKTQEDVSTKLNKMGITATAQQIVTTSIATAKFIQARKKQARCYVIGEDGLHQAIEEQGLTITDQDCDFVVVGIDRNISYDKLAKACLAVRDGATFISTNGDVAIPSERGLLPGNGSLTSVITVSTGVAPTFIGKPESIIMEEALTVLGVKKDEALMVGDNYATDIRAGIGAGMDTLMVFTGVTPIKEYPNLEIQPTYYVHSLHEWLQHI